MSSTTSEATKDISLEELIANSVRNALNAEAIQERVQAAATKAVEESIDSAFRYNSEFRKSITTAVETVLPTVDATMLARFAHAAREVIQNRLGNLANETAKAHVDEVLNKILPDSTVITFKDLKEAYQEKIRDQRAIDDCSCVEDEDFDWLCEIDQSGTVSGYWHVTFGPDEGQTYSSDNVRLAFCPKDRDSSNSLYECYNVNGGDPQNFTSLFVGALYGFDAMVFRLATGTSFLSTEGERSFSS
jgi:hypothetical protein